VFDSEADVAQLIVGMTPALASALARGEHTKDTSRLQHLTTRAHLDLKPQHVRSLDPLRTTPPQEGPGGDEETIWFWAETGDDQPGHLGAALDDVLDNILDDIVGVPGVTAAYVKPPDGPP
jgi:hypothetical protein